VGVLEIFVDGEGSAVDSSDGPAFCFPVIEAGGCHDDLFSDLPVDVFGEGESVGVGGDSGGEGGPGGSPGLAVHGELALHAADALVAEHRQLLIVVVSVQDEIEFTLMWALFCACDEPSSHHSDEPGIDGEVEFVREDDSGIGCCDSSQIGSVLIDEQGHSGGDAD